MCSFNLYRRIRFCVYVIMYLLYLKFKAINHNKKLVFLIFRHPPRVSKYATCTLCRDTPFTNFRRCKEKEK